MTKNHKTNFKEMNLTKAVSDQPLLSTITIIVLIFLICLIFGQTGFKNTTFLELCRIFLLPLAIPVGLTIYNRKKDLDDQARLKRQKKVEQDKEIEDSSLALYEKFLTFMLDYQSTEEREFLENPEKAPILERRITAYLNAIQSKFYKNQIVIYLLQSDLLQRVDNIIKGQKFTEFECAHIRLNQTKIPGLKIESSDFSQSSFTNSEMKGCNFSECTFNGANFSESEIKACTFENNNLKGANFSSSKLRNSKIFCRRTGYNEDDQSPFSFSNADMSHTHIRNFYRDNADFSEIQANATKIQDSNFYKTNFTNCVFQERSQFIGCKFNNVDFTSSMFANVSFRHCQFKNCKTDDILMRNIDFFDCKFEEYQFSAFAEYVNCKFKKCNLDKATEKSLDYINKKHGGSLTVDERLYIPDQIAQNILAKINEQYEICVPDGRQYKLLSSIWYCYNNSDDEYKNYQDIRNYLLGQFPDLTSERIVGIIHALAMSNSLIFDNENELIMLSDSIRTKQDIFRDFDNKFREIFYKNESVYPKKYIEGKTLNTQLTPEYEEFKLPMPV